MAGITESEMCDPRQKWPLYKFRTEDEAEPEMLPFELHEQTGAFSKWPSESSCTTPNRSMARNNSYCI
jgi:hypothetical protein